VCACTPRRRTACYTSCIRITPACAGASLGSASVMLNSSGAKIGEMRYTPFGETRLITGSVPTDRRYTGQRQESVGLGSLYDYGARFYSPALGRFLSADTIVPEPGNPQSLNRFSYSNNSPLRYTDPSGHCGADVNADGSINQTLNDQCIEMRDRLAESFGIAITGRWSFIEMEWLGKALTDYRTTIGNKGWVQLVLPRLKSIERGIREGGIIGGYDEELLNIEIHGAYIAPWPEDEGLDTGTVFKQIVAHELTHPLVKSRPVFLEWFMQDAGWGEYRGFVWSDVPAEASAYARSIAGKFRAPEEDFAEYFSRSIYQSQRALSVNYREALARLHHYVWWDYVRRGTFGR